MPLTTIAAGPALRSVLNTNFALCVLTDTAKTITVTHSWTAAQTFTGGWTAAAACTVAGAINVTSANVATGGSRGFLDYLSPAVRLQSYGIDASTNGTIQIISRRSDGSNTLTVLASDTSGNLTATGTFIAPASSTSVPSLRVPHGSAPSAPTNGDIWTTSSGLYVRINGATVGPLS